jgi:hypothetical protein
VLDRHLHFSAAQRRCFYLPFPSGGTRVGYQVTSSGQTAVVLISRLAETGTSSPEDGPLRFIMEAIVAALILLSIPGNCLTFESPGPQDPGSLQWPLGIAAQYVNNGSWTAQSTDDGCSSLEEGKFDPITWTISTRIFCPNQFSTAPYVANGYFGQALPSESVGYWVERLPNGSPASNG